VAPVHVLNTSYRFLAGDTLSECSKRTLGVQQVGASHGIC
jgi:hypothetical protein